MPDAMFCAVRDSFADMNSITDTHTETDSGRSNGKVLMILIDGVGIGPEGRLNPVNVSSTMFHGLHPEAPTRLPGDGWAVPTRADLGVPGLPQSATGHTSILTGVNASKTLGRHFPGFPLATLKRLIAKRNILSDVQKAGLRGEYVNAFRPVIPEVMQRRGLKSASTLAALSCGQKLRSLEDIPEGRALYHDFTNRTLVESGERMPVFTPKQAGRTLASIASENDFTLYEYFLTDIVGHTQDLGKAQREVSKIHAFLEGVLGSFDLSRSHVLVCSDHGNIEDLSVRTHTLNPVPTMIWGPKADPASFDIRSIDRIPHVAAALLAIRNQRNNGSGE